jgi:putative membrane protein
MVAWFAGLFYLPRLFVYHAMSDDVVGIERFKIMERKLYRAIMTPAAVIAIASGIALIAFDAGAYLRAGWMQLKLILVTALVGYHLYSGKLLTDFLTDRNTRGDVFFRWFNEIPAVILIAVVILVVVKPF